MTQHKSILAAISLTFAMAASGAAQQAPSTPLALPNDTCAGCFAYLEFSPSLEPESYAVRGQAPEAAASLPAAGEATGRSGEQTAGLLASSKQ